MDPSAYNWPSFSKYNQYSYPHSYPPTPPDDTAQSLHNQHHHQQQLQQQDQQPMSSSPMPSAAGMAAHLQNSSQDAASKYK